MCDQSKKSVGGSGFLCDGQLRLGIQVYRVSRCLEDHERVERRDAIVAAHVPARVGRLEARDLERKVKRSIAEGSAIALRVGVACYSGADGVWVRYTLLDGCERR